MRGFSFLRSRPTLGKLKSVSNMFTISVDGNISSGKSTLVQKLYENWPQLKTRTKGVQIIPEPLGKWCNLQGHNLLQKYYDDPTNNNFLFQHYVQLTRLQDTIQTQENAEDGDKENGPNFRLMERSLQNNRYCFLELARASGNLHDVEFAVLAEWYSWLEEHLDLNLDIVLYLRTDPDTVFNRMKSRGRAEESLVPLDYLRSLHQCYDTWLMQPKQTKSDRNNYQVIVIDGNQSQEEVFAEAVKLLTDKLKSMLPQYQTRNNANPPAL